MEHPGADRVGVLVDEGDGLLDLGDGAAGFVEPGDAGERGQEPDAVDAGPRLGVAHLVPELDGPLVFDARLRERIAGLCRATGGHRRLEGARQVVRGIPVVGELGRVRGVDPGPGLERAREGRVPARSFAREDLVVDGLLEQRVPEGVAVDARGRVRHEDLPRDALAQRVDQRRLVERRGVGEERRIDALAGRRRDPQELLGGFREVGDPRQQHVAQRGREFGPAIVAGGDEQLLGEERVAVRTGMDRLDEPWVEVVAGDGLELGADVAQVEGLELDPLDTAASLELGKE